MANKCFLENPTPKAKFYVQVRISMNLLNKKSPLIQASSVKLERISKNENFVAQAEEWTWVVLRYLTSWTLCIAIWQIPFQLSFKDDC